MFYPIQSICLKIYYCNAVENKINREKTFTIGPDAGNFVAHIRIIINIIMES